MVSAPVLARHNNSIKTTAKVNYVVNDSDDDTMSGESLF